MKKVSMFLLAVLLIASLFISCDNSTKALTDELVEVRIGNGSGDRSLDATVDMSDEGIVWYYSAHKVTETQFKYGETNGTVLTDNSVTLSQGRWDFGLWAVKNGKKVYSGTVINALITKNENGSPVSVVVPVSPYTGDKGYIALKDVKIHAKTTSGSIDVTPNYAKIDTNEISGFNGTADAIEVDTGSHTVTVAYKGTDGVTYASETIYVTVYSGRETLVTGFLDEETGSANISHESTVAIVGIDGGVQSGVASTVFVGVTPSMEKGTEENPIQTTVMFPEGSFSNTEVANAALTVNVKPIDSKFSVGATGTSTDVVTVAGLDIALLVDNKPVTEFNKKEVTITTYIAKGLKEVKVYYDNVVIPGSTYDSGSGMLTFKTTHFSEFYVGSARVEAYNAKTNTAYSDLSVAISKALDGDIIQLLADCSYATNGSGLWNITKSITLDGNEHTISGYGNRSNNKTTLAINNLGSKEVEVVLKDLTISNDAEMGRAIETRGNIKSLTLNNVAINLNGSGNNQGLTIGGNQSSVAEINIVDSSIDVGNAGYSYISFNPAKVTIENSKFSGYCSMYFKGINVSEGSHGTVINANNSIFDSPNAHSSEGKNDFGVFVFEDNDVKINLNNCSINAKTMSSAYQAVFDFSIYSKRKGDVTITIDGEKTNVYGTICKEGSKDWEGSITIKNGNYYLTQIEKITDGYKYSSAGMVELSVKGGTFNVDPSKYLADGYCSVAQDNNWIVQEAPVVIGTKGYATLESAVNDSKNGDTIVLLKDIDLSAPITISKSITLTSEVSCKYSLRGYTVTASNGVINFSNIIFDSPRNSSNNASNLYVTNDAEVTVDGCVFKDSQWDSIQVTSGVKKITINNCVFSTSEDITPKPQRYIHIQETTGNIVDGFYNYPVEKPVIVITGNTFNNVSLLAQDFAEVDYIHPKNVTVGKNTVNDIGNNVGFNIYQKQNPPVEYSANQYQTQFVGDAIVNLSLDIQ